MSLTIKMYLPVIIIAIAMATRKPMLFANLFFQHIQF